MPTVSGRLNRTRLIRAGLLIVAPLAVEWVFELFISPEGIANGRWLQNQLLYALSQYNFVGFIGHFFLNFAAVPAAVGGFLAQFIGDGLPTTVLLVLALPFAWAFAFLWTPFDLVLTAGVLTLIIAILQIVAAWIIIDRGTVATGEGGKTLTQLAREPGDGYDRVSNWAIIYLVLMIFSTILGAVLYGIVGGGTFLLGWALDLAGLFLMANTIIAFIYLFVMKIAEEKTTEIIEKKIKDTFREDGKA
jgi:hypothetical protein